MTFTLNIEKVCGGYILTIESPDSVERIVVGLERPFVNDLENLRRMNLAIGTTILSKAGFKWEDKNFVLNIGCYGDVEQDGVEPSSEASEWSPEDYERYISCLQRLGCPEQPENINTKWFKEHCHYRAQWKPTEAQMQALYKMVCECRPADQQLLQDLYYGLRSLL